MRSVSLTVTALAFAALLATGAQAQTNTGSTTKRTRIVIHPSQWTVEPPPTAKRYCTSWLEKEYRVSGPVIVPRMQCRWQ